LLSFANAHELIELRPSWPLRRIAATAAGCDLFVGLDSPITQLCYAVGVPVFLLAGALSPKDALSWHGDRSGIWCDEFDDFLRLAEVFLGCADRRYAPAES
jgi:ADP-heptose:LPS heptosyltransferase